MPKFETEEEIEQTLEERGEKGREEEEDDEFSDIDLVEKELAIEEPEDKYAYLRDKARTLAADYRGTINAENAAFTKAFIDLYGSKKRPGTGIQTKIDDEFEEPSLLDLPAVKYWEAFKEKNKIIMLQNTRIKRKLNECLEEYVKIIKELFKLYLEKEKEAAMSKSGEMDEKEVIRKYFSSVGKSREFELIKMYNECPDIAEFNKWVVPHSTGFKPAERMFLRILNRVKNRFSDRFSDIE